MTTTEVTASEYPPLVFPEPVRVERTKRSSVGGQPRAPTAGQQAQRLAPQFRRLQEAMDRKRIALQRNSLGIQPEQVLVLETVGSIDDFINATKRIRGLEWLEESELDNIEPEYGFEDESNPEKQLRGQLFLVMSDQQALREMQRLFDRWREDPYTEFPYGLAKFRTAFNHLRDIRPWNAEDRIRETGLLEDWQLRLEHGFVDVPFEVELWFRNNGERRQQAESNLHGIVQSLGGRVVQQCVIPEITYHAMLGTIPPSQAREMIGQIEAGGDVRLIGCEDIMYIRPVGQCAVPIPEEDPDTGISQPIGPQNIPTGKPIVALLDGLPLTGHRLLDGRVVVDDPDGYESDYLANERFHGTTMASLICYGDLNDGGGVIDRLLYARPIMKPRRGFSGFEEAIPANVLPIDLVHRAVQRLYESENSEPPVAHSVKVINLSIGNQARPFDRDMSAWARLLDWLSWKYNVLFVVSAGNHLQAVELEVQGLGIQFLSDQDREAAVIRAVTEDTRNRRLLAPAETVNGLTVGAVHADASSPPSKYLTDPFVQSDMPSVISAHGPGYRRSVKPDVLLPGGKQLLSPNPKATSGTKVTLPLSMSNQAPGQLVAVPGVTGRLNETWYTRGTSNATALASRGAHILYDVIERLREESGTDIPVEFDTVLLKTLLVHGAGWRGASSAYKSALRNSSNGITYRDLIGRFLGYGSADIDRVAFCNNQRVTVLGTGKLNDGDGNEFRLPLPPSLAGVAHKRRLTITLAWLTPVNTTRQNYRVAHLWFDPKQQNIIAPDRQDADHRAVQRGTVQHEILEGGQVVSFQDGDDIVIKVNCRSDAGDILKPISYGLAVTLEVAETSDIPIYQEVRSRLVTPILV